MSDGVNDGVSGGKGVRSGQYDGNNGSLPELSGEVKALWHGLAAELTPVLASAGLSGEAGPLESAKPVGDDPAKLLLKDATGRPAAVLFCSRPIAPELIARAVDRSASAKRLLGRRLGRVVLSPIASGAFQGLSYVLFPWRWALSHTPYVRAMQRTLLRPRLFSWLRGVTKQTMRPTDRNVANFAAALRHTAEDTRLTTSLREAGSEAAAQLAAGQWLPYTVLAHNDLWLGNVLLESRWFWPVSAAAGRLAIIDWGGADPCGYPVYDLVRLADSTHLTGKVLADEVKAHCEILGCTPRHAKWYLAAALGNLGLHLEYFPEARFLELAERCWNVLTSVI
ncbi:MAG: phosphotransferase [Pseudomonadota bacterium]